LSLLSLLRDSLPIDLSSIELLPDERLELELS